MFRDLKNTNHIDFNDVKTRDIYIFIYYISKLITMKLYIKYLKHNILLN